MGRQPNSSISPERRKQMDKRNKRRRERYAKDRAYRQNCKRTSREALREARGTVSDIDRISAVERAIDRLEKSSETHCTKRPMVVNGVDQRPRLTLNSEEMAKCLGLWGVNALRTIHQSGRFPRPSYEARAYKAVIPVYLRDDALKLLRIMRDHYRVKSYLHANDKETLDRLFAVQ